MTARHDPFEQLRVETGESIDATFSARLRSRVERALGTAPERVTLEFPRRDATKAPSAATSAASTNEPRSERNSTMSQVITPYLCVHDATASLDWYRDHFGATVSNVIPWEGRVGHAEIDVAGAVFYLSDEAPQLGVVAPARDGSQTAVSIVLQVAAVEQFVERAHAGGAVVQRPIEEAHGMRSAWIVDPFGHRWNVGTPVSDDEQ